MSQPFQHSPAFRRRRFLNWFPMGLTYAFLYMGRYNLTVAKNALGQAMTKEDFGTIFAAGTLTYAFAFLLNGPLTDRIGGRKAILAAALGSGFMNLLMGLYIHFGVAQGVGADTMVPVFSVLYAVNMYFQSFGAVAIVKVNSHWFHVRERGGFGGIFGTMIASGVFFAFTVNGWVLDWVTPANAVSQIPTSMWVFFLPSAILFGMFGVELAILRDRPTQAGFEDFDTGDASSGEMDQEITTPQLIRKILTNPIILVVACIEFCSGVLRNGVMHWFPFYAQEVLGLESGHYLVNGDWGRWYLTVVPFLVLAALFFFLSARAAGRRKAWYAVSGALMFIAPFVQGGWGGILMVAGVIGSNVAGWVSDLFFQSRRAPAAGGLYLGLILATSVMVFVLGGTTTTVRWSDPDPKAAEDGFDVLLPGDQVLSIAGATDLEKWTDVTRAVACVVPRCVDSTWDPAECICTGGEVTAGGTAAGPAADGGIAAVVKRDGQERSLRLRDSTFQKGQRAGDKRKLKAGPELILWEYWLGLVIFLMSLCVIGSHGLLSGTATMDFGGRKGAATAVGMIDGFVYLGTGFQSLVLGHLTTRAWTWWPVFLVPFALLGFFLATRIWRAVPGRSGGGH
ncbi:MAG: MFS transporter [Deltaproteobacteria bacterium]|nr:MFS transporter [Deltaproteobacteria bacterium]